MPLRLTGWTIALALALAGCGRAADDGGTADLNCPTGWHASGDRCARSIPGGAFGSACTKSEDCGCLTQLGDDDPLCTGDQSTQLQCYSVTGAGGVSGGSMCSVPCSNDGDCHLALGSADARCIDQHCKK